MTPHASRRRVVARVLAAIVGMTIVAPTAARAQLAPTSTGDPTLDLSREASVPARAGVLSPPRKAPAAYGDEGSLVLSGAFAVEGGMTWFSDSDATRAYFRVSPSIDYFVFDDVSLGMTIPLYYQSRIAYSANGAKTEHSTTSFGVGLRLGYNARLSPRVSLHLQGAIGVASSQTTQELIPSGSASPSGASANYEHGHNDVWIGASAPLVLHLVTHLFVGFGPALHLDLLSESDRPGVPQHQRTTIGADLSVGGWW